MYQRAATYSYKYFITPIIISQLTPVYAEYVISIFSLWEDFLHVLVFPP